MKDLIIKDRQIKKELLLLAGAFILAFFINVGAILAYGRPWSELYTQLGYVVCLALVIYFLIVAVRLLIWALVWIIKKLFKI